jgi:hypothetical protein
MTHVVNGDAEANVAALRADIENLDVSEDDGGNDRGPRRLADADRAGCDEPGGRGAPGCEAVHTSLRAMSVQQGHTMTCYFNVQLAAGGSVPVQVPGDSKPSFAEVTRFFVGST